MALPGAFLTYIERCFFLMFRSILMKSLIEMNRPSIARPILTLTNGVWSSEASGSEVGSVEALEIFENTVQGEIFYALK